MQSQQISFKHAHSHFPNARDKQACLLFHIGPHVLECWEINGNDSILEMCRVKTIVGAWDASDYDVRECKCFIQCDIRFKDLGKLISNTSISTRIYLNKKLHTCVTNYIPHAYSTSIPHHDETPWSHSHRRYIPLPHRSHTMQQVVVQRPLIDWWLWWCVRAVGNRMEWLNYRRRCVPLF